CRGGDAVASGGVSRISGRGIADAGGTSGRSAARDPASSEHSVLSTQQRLTRMAAVSHVLMTWVKICGMTNLEDALVAVEAGADAVGFVFYEESPRKVSVESARGIVEKLPESVEKVGVFVGAECERIRAVALDVGLTAVQLHGKRALDSVWKDTR